MNDKSAKIKALFRLLDDENDGIASTAMNELLSSGENIKSHICEKQEAPNPLLRRRIHQMQAILKARKARNILSRRFSSRHSGLWSGLVDIHLLWYDRESRDFLEMDLDWLLEKLEPCQKPDSAYFADFMKKQCYVVSMAGDIDADFYCIGSVINSRIGADFILCALIARVASCLSWTFQVATEADGRFVVIGQDGAVVEPYSWSIAYPPDLSKYKICETGTILRITVNHLFLSTVCSDSHRYIYSIGKCISEAAGNNTNSLPYPFTRQQK